MEGKEDWGRKGVGRNEGVEEGKYEVNVKEKGR